MKPVHLTQRFETAFHYAFKLHALQVRKGTTVPYISHLMAVCALVLEDGGDEDEAIAALLHDAVEDQGGLRTLEEIRERYGDRVARIVRSCSDSSSLIKPPWRERKEEYLAHLPSALTDEQRVSLADKLHNARSITADLRQSGSSVWKRFRGGKDGTLWYYRSLVEIFEKISSSPMAGELSRVVAEMVRLADGAEA